MTTECYGCKCVKENGPLSKVYGPPDRCLDCAARAIASVYGGMPKDIVDEKMHQAWPDTKTFTEGRRLFWVWASRIDEAKAKQ